MYSTKFKSQLKKSQWWPILFINSCRNFGSKDSQWRVLSATYFLLLYPHLTVFYTETQMWQVQEKMVSTLEQIQVPNGTVSGVPRSKRPLLASRTRCNDKKSVVLKSYTCQNNWWDSHNFLYHNYIICRHNL